MDHGIRERSIPEGDEPPARVLVVDDEPPLRRAVAKVLLSRGMEVLIAADGAAALEILASESIDVALVDLMMPHVNGLELLARVKSEMPAVEVVIMTAFGDVETAVQAVRAGAFHFLTKPFRNHDEVVHTLLKAVERRRLLERAARLEERLEERERFGELIGNSEPMRRVYELAIGVAPASTTVLILGESGTGKELTARAIHQHSSRARGAFVAVNCSAIPVELIESELFGHLRGAFTGAVATREGLFEAADRGTLFLDEVGDLPALAQVKLLRALQEGEIKRVGSDAVRRVDVRVIAATNVDLRKRVEQGRFREDLFYRLNVVAIELPPLRDRRVDIPLLAQHFLRRSAERAGRRITKLDPETVRVLEQHSWPGNVRELANAIEFAVVFCREETVLPSDLPAALHLTRAGASRAGAESGGSSRWRELPYREAKEAALRDFERAYFQALLERSQGNVSAAAREAGLDRSNFRRAARRAGVFAKS